MPLPEDTHTDINKYTNMDADTHAGETGSIPGPRAVSTVLMKQ